MGGKIGRTVDYVAGRSRYVSYLLSLAGGSFRGFRVGLDCANGSASSLARAVFDALGAEVCAIGVSPDGCNINEGCGSTHPEALCALVCKERLDLGFAFDGDADRCIAADGEGNVVDGDGILYLAARALKRQGEATGVVLTPMSGMGLVRSLERERIPCFGRTSATVLSPKRWRGGAVFWAASPRDTSSSASLPRRETASSRRSWSWRRCGRASARSPASWKGSNAFPARSAACASGKSALFWRAKACGSPLSARKNCSRAAGSLCGLRAPSRSSAFWRRGEQGGV